MACYCRGTGCEQSRSWQADAHIGVKPDWGVLGRREGGEGSGGKSGDAAIKKKSAIINHPGQPVFGKESPEGALRMPFIMSMCRGGAKACFSKLLGSHLGIWGAQKGNAKASQESH